MNAARHATARRSWEISRAAGYAGNGALLMLEVDAKSADALNAVFRVMHTLKGAAHATDQPLVERACHHLEATLVEAREAASRSDSREFTLLFAAAARSPTRHVG